MDADIHIYMYIVLVICTTEKKEKKDVRVKDTITNSGTKGREEENNGRIFPFFLFSLMLASKDRR